MNACELCGSGRNESRGLPRAPEYGTDGRGDLPPLKLCGECERRFLRELVRAENLADLECVLDSMRKELEEKR